MNTATQLGNAQPLAGNPLLQQGAAAATPQLAPSASEHGSPNPETLPFDAELQALLATLPGLQGGESAEGDVAAQAPSPAIPAPVEQGPEHAEALLGLLSAQQQQQVHAQQAPQASVSKTAAQAARVPETLPGLQTAVPPQAPADAALRDAQPLPAQVRVDELDDFAVKMGGVQLACGGQLADGDREAILRRRCGDGSGLASC